MAKEMNDTATRKDNRRIYNPVQKDAATFLETSEETGGERTLIEIEAAPAGGRSLTNAYVRGPRMGAPYRRADARSLVSERGMKALTTKGR